MEFLSLFNIFNQPDTENTGCLLFTHEFRSPGVGGTPYNGLYGEAPPERLQVYKRVRISQTEVYKRVGKSVI